MEGKKLCKQCNVVKSLDDFYNKGKNNRQSYCKTCESKIKYKKYMCDCGKLYTYLHKQRHLRSNYHIKRVS